MPQSVLTRLRSFGPHASVDDDAFVTWVDDVCAALEVQAGQRLYDAGGGAGAFLWPPWSAGWQVGGLVAGSAALAAAQELMPSGHWSVGAPGDLDPGDPWDIVVVSGAFGSFPGPEYARGVLARMAAKATVAMAVLDVRDGDGGVGDDRQELAFTRGWFLRQLGEIGVTAVQFRASRLPGRLDAFDVLARV
jgi:hypothetical protein